VAVVTFSSSQGIFAMKNDCKLGILTQANHTGIQRLKEKQNTSL
jgi:hypothetical protein